MEIYDIIKKKRDGAPLSEKEIAFFVKGATNGTIADYQISALLMAMFIRGLDKAETLTLTMEMAKSGDMLPVRPGTSDKHSTGGCGDTTTFIVLPLVMAAGGKMAKMSGRGLGHTGGTIDKAEAIPGFRTILTTKEFDTVLEKTSGVLTAQSGNFAPADKIFYALRDVTATVDSIPLIAASIMSKKLALGAEKIVLDVKCGQGAFMKTEADARALALTMVEIGKGAGRDVKALITRMDAPLGRAVGNSLEITEAVETLRGKKGPLYDVSLALSSLLTGKPEAELRQYIENGQAFDALCRLVGAQGGDTSVLENPALFKKALYTKEVFLPASGYISGIDGELIGLAAVRLGAGRKRKEDPIDPSAGILMHKTIGDESQGRFCTLFTDRKEILDEVADLVCAAVTTEKEKPSEKSIIIDSIE